MSLPHETPATGVSAEMASRLQQVIPTIQLDAMTLRAPKIEDFPFYAEIAAGPSGRFFLGEPTREAAWYDFANMTAAWVLRGHGLWTVITLEGEVLGFVLLGFEPGDHEPELGFLFRAQAEGKGFAFSAAKAARDYAYGRLGWTTLVSTIDHENERSIRLAARLGACRDHAAEAAHQGKVRVYRHPTPVVC